MNNEPVLYRGIDFVLKTRKPAEALSQELGRHIRYNQVWQGTRTIVLSLSGTNSTLDTEIIRFCRMINRLSPKAKRCWKTCSARLIDIGIDSGNVPHKEEIVPLHLLIKSATLRKIAAIQSELKVTVYPLINAPEAGAEEKPAASIHNLSVPIFKAQSTKKIHFSSNMVNPMDEVEDNQRHEACLRSTKSTRMKKKPSSRSC